MASLDRSQSSHSTLSISSRWSPTWSPTSGTRVLAIECVRGTSRAEEWSGELLQTGDIVEEIAIGDLILRAPFKDGKSGVYKQPGADLFISKLTVGIRGICISSDANPSKNSWFRHCKQLHSYFKNKVSSIRVKVRRGEFDSAELVGCIVPDGKKKQRYLVRAIDDPNYAVRFFDITESECWELQASRESRLQHALDSSQIQDGYVNYPWEKKMQDMLQVPNSSAFMSILFLPKDPRKGSGRYHDLEYTLSAANAWLNAVQVSGVPIVFKNVQTESLLTKISGETASSTVNTSSLSDLPSLANASLYGFEDYHGVDIGVVKAVRLWYSPIQEYPVEIDIKEGDSKLGFVIARTEEGFMYIASVLQGDENVPSTRSGLNKLFTDATIASKLLVISRINNQKILPWIVSSSGTIQSFDTVSVSQKLSLHRHAGVPILIHVFLSENCTTSSRSRNDTAPVPLAMPFLPEDQGTSDRDIEHTNRLSLSEMMNDTSPDDEMIDLQLLRDASFRFTI